MNPMKRRPQDNDKPAITHKNSLEGSRGEIGLVLSGGGSRAAYQVGALKALIPFLEKSPDPVSVVLGSSIGAINGLLFSACIKKGPRAAVEQLELVWAERTFKNSFAGTQSAAFFRAIKMAAKQYANPGPSATTAAIFDPTPLMNRIDQVITEFGGLEPKNRDPNLKAVGVMTTVEGAAGVERRPLLFVSAHQPIDPTYLVGASFEVAYVPTLAAKHGFASAALPAVLPPVELDTDAGRVRLVDGGISQNIPVDPAVRLGARRVVVIDISGRDYWLNHYNEALDTRPSWEIPAGLETFCFRPPDTLVLRAQKPLGPILKSVVHGSTRKFIHAVGAVWPLFTLLKRKLGEDLAYEVMSYVALDPEYCIALMERGYQETTELLRSKDKLEFHHNDSFESLAALK